MGNRLDELRSAPCDRLLLRLVQIGPVPQVALENDRGLHGHAAARPADEAPRLEFLGVPVHRHLAHAKPVG
jgi:hypothetical protein